MPYQNIQNYPNNANNLGSSELSVLSSIWHEKKSELEQTDIFKAFLRKMQREWAIETGIIERLYNWDRGVTEILIEEGINAISIKHNGGIAKQEADHIKCLINDQLAIVEGLFGFIKGEQPLTEHYIRGLQAHFTQHQNTTEALTPNGKLIQIKLEKGVYKKHPNNPRRPDGEIHWYCPPEQTQPEMENLVAWYRESENKYPPEVHAAWLHHRFTQIHPFQDGNGRVARTLASLVFIKAGLFPLVIRDSDREAYISALEEADAGDIKALVDLFVRRQTTAILSALKLRKMVKVKTVEKKIWDFEGLDVLFKYSQNDRDVRGDKGNIPQYNKYKKMAKNNMTVAEYKKNRIYPNYPGFDIDVYDGNGEIVSGQTKLSTVRDSYLDDEIND